jgi:hypothetical protein
MVDNGLYQLTTVDNPLLPAGKNIFSRYQPLSTVFNQSAHAQNLAA